MSADGGGAPALQICRRMWAGRACWILCDREQDRTSTVLAGGIFFIYEQVKKGKRREHNVLGSRLEAFGKGFTAEILPLRWVLRPRNMCLVGQKG